MKVFIVVFSFVSLAWSPQAISSHCKYLSSKYALKAFQDLSNLKKKSKMPIIDRYCESCKDTYVKPIVLDEIKYQPYQVKGYGSLSINGEEVDLAYLYLDGVNLGHKYNCKTKVSSKLLFTEEEENQNETL